MRRLLDYIDWRGWSDATSDHYWLHPLRSGRIRHPLFDHRGDTIGAQDYRRDADPRWLTPKGTKLALFGQQNLANIDETVPTLDVTEGISDCITITEALGTSHAVVGLPGAAGWRPQYSAGLVTVTLIVWPDNDEAGQRFAAKVADLHRVAGGRVRVGKVPEGHNDLADWRNAEPMSFAAEFLAAREAAE